MRFDKFYAKKAGERKGEPGGPGRAPTGPLAPILGMAAAFTEWVWREPDTSDPAWHKPLRGAARVPFIVAQEFRRDAILLRASALTFTMVLSLVPLLALGTAVSKGLGAGDQLRTLAYRMIDEIEAGRPAAPAAEPGKAPAAAPRPPGYTAHLRLAVDKLFSYVDRTRFTTLGVVGVIGLLLTVVSLLGNIEASMNAIWQARKSRPLSRKFTDYLALMIWFPVAAMVGLATEAALRSPAFMARFQAVLPMHLVTPVFLEIFPLFLVVLVFTMFYRYLPNTTVRWGPALAGGLAGGLLWLWAQSLYVALQVGVTRYNAIYGSFATVPLFLGWIYLAWVVFLLGAETAFAVQVWRRYKPGAMELRPIARLALVLDVLVVLLRNFRTRTVTHLDDLSRQLWQTEALIGTALADLLRAGLVEQVEGRGERFVPTAPADEISMEEIVELVLGSDYALGETPGGRTAKLALAGAKAATQRTGLAGLAAGPETG
ncbi:YihY/virulence factor BrkB family protein [Dissulfurirhabdus thermomarina]|uniref:YihY/virulence factor BrkB family protein n=1 Tax=Dissulfurirhabdus thermomarina TaxID=1765737 RepID=A0A6N9TWI2_DISTH|nr:YihY/virulence factor BrkB family protein [Dissulfurirhabdus thermomarina]NDY42846.1 YihY/virulence factor BrkB family protein [Dissulfurirhabdus thermomarina]NMX23244.1 YihY/virulence factor BrkB family protein [Dissulfurirhabdus thermomarina]